MSESDRHIGSVQSALSLLTCFDRDIGLRLEDLHERTGLIRSRIIRMAGTLVHEGFLIHDAGASKYYLGPNLYRLGSMLADRYGSIASGARPILRELVEATGLTAMFSVIGGRDRMILAKEEPEDAVRYTVREGQPRVMTAGASGRVMLAFAEPKFAKALIRDCNLSKRAKADLLDSLDDVRARGFEISHSELTRHAFAVAVPVLAFPDRLLGVLTLAGPTPAYRESDVDELVALLTEKAARIPASAQSIPSASVTP